MLRACKVHPLACSWLNAGGPALPYICLSTYHRYVAVQLHSVRCYTMSMQLYFNMVQRTTVLVRIMVWQQYPVHYRHRPRPNSTFAFQVAHISTC